MRPSVSEETARFGAWTISTPRPPAQNRSSGCWWPTSSLTRNSRTPTGAFRCALPSAAGRFDGSPARSVRARGPTRWPVGWARKGESSVTCAGRPGFPTTVVTPIRPSPGANCSSKPSPRPLTGARRSVGREKPTRRGYTSNCVPGSGSPRQPTSSARACSARSFAPPSARGSPVRSRSPCPCTSAVGGRAGSRPVHRTSPAFWPGASPCSPIRRWSSIRWLTAS